MIGRILNAVAFQAVWIACVAGGASGRWWLGVAAVAAFALWQLPRSERPRSELALAGIALGLGTVADGVFTAAGVLRYPEPGPWRHVAPVWILALWVGFALTLNHSLVWLRGRPALAAVLGAGGGTLSYWIGARGWGAVELVAPLPVAAAVLAACWAAVTALLVMAAARLAGPRLAFDAVAG